jgi:hypothetical protein
VDRENRRLVETLEREFESRLSVCGREALEQRAQIGIIAVARFESRQRLVDARADAPRKLRGRRAGVGDDENLVDRERASKSRRNTSAASVQVLPVPAPASISRMPESSTSKGVKCRSVIAQTTP